MTGVKNDTNKTQWWFFDNFWKYLKEVVEVLEFGNSKYPSEDGANWKRVEGGRRRYNDALFRHVLSYRSGEKIDPESNKSHLAHTITNALFLMWLDDQENQGIVYDDATIDAILNIVENACSNATNYSSIYSMQSDRQFADAFTDALFDEIAYLKGKQNG